MLSPRVIYEDENFLAVNKPAGMLVHGIIGKRRPSFAKASARREESQEPTLVDWLIERYPDIKNVGDNWTSPSTGSGHNSSLREDSMKESLRPGIVHRLDRDTSGVMIVAKNQKYFEYLKSLFQKRQIKKTYLALVYGRVEPKTGMIREPIGIKSGKIKRTIHSGKMRKEAETEYKVLKHFNDEPGVKSGEFSLLEVRPKTGRTHQIRVHLASIGHPVVGDTVYGGKRGKRKEESEERKVERRVKKSGSELFSIHYSLSTPRLMLHASSLEFTAQDGQRIKVEAAPPADFLHSLRGRW